MIGVAVVDRGGDSVDDGGGAASATAGATASKVRNPLLDIALRDFNGDFLPFLMMQLGTAQLSVGGSGCNVGLVDSSRDDLA